MRDKCYAGDRVPWESRTAHLLEGEAVDEVLGQTEQLDRARRTGGRAAEGEQGQHDFGGATPEDGTKGESDGFLQREPGGQDGRVEGAAKGAERGVDDKRGDGGRNGVFGATRQKMAGGQAGGLRHAKHSLVADSGVGHPSGSAPAPQIGPKGELQERHEAGAQNSSGDTNDGQVWRMVVIEVREGFSHKAHFR